MDELDSALFRKLVGMFRPCTAPFLDHPDGTVVLGPEDRSLFTLTTHFPKSWLVEDFGFTPEEADRFVALVNGDPS